MNVRPSARSNLPGLTPADPVLDGSAVRIQDRHRWRCRGRLYVPSAILSSRRRRVVYPCVRSLAGARGRLCPDEATRVARVLLLDILIYDSDLAASYPENGRTLTHDVVDVLLSVLTSGKVIEDNVGDHHDLLTLNSRTWGHRTKTTLDLKEDACPV
jgi:hypothetical protein